MRAVLRTLAVGCSCLALLHSTRAAGTLDPLPRKFPGWKLGEALRGERAIQALGGRLNEIAAEHRLEGEDLRRMFQRDHTLAIDDTGRLHFTEEPLPAGAPEEGMTALGVDTQILPWTPAATFTLHSKPGSKRTLYIDFNGHLLSGTAWNVRNNGGTNIVAPAWDLDGSPGTFGTNECARIQMIWQRVAEDYAPLDVDVTTELTDEAVLTRSSSSDDVYGVRVLVSPISSYFGNYGGIAYVGVFDSTGDYYKPALVFPEKLANSEKYIAEAVSHEAGHTLGLSHDGTTTGTAYYLGQGSGDTGWAPIMGAGYYKNLSQWSKGEYAYANNLEDDLTIIQQNGLALRADDHGNSAGTATVLPGGATWQSWGLITSTNDSDWFRFSAGAGVATLVAAPAALGPNLDITLELRDAMGGLLASTNPPTSLGATISTTLSGGDYFLVVRGCGSGDPSTTGYTAYGSLGQYLISGTVAAPTSLRTLVAPVAAVRTSSQSGTAPWVVTLDGSTSTDADGWIASWNWNFGDGTQGTGSVVTHTYANAGSYVATLTVTDNDGLTSSASFNLSAQAATVSDPRLVVGSLKLIVGGSATAKAVTAVVRVTTPSGAPVVGATVKAGWSGLISGTSSAVTDANGNATMTSKRVSTNGTITFAVTGVTKSGSVYAPDLNLVSSATATITGL